MLTLLSSHPTSPPFSRSCLASLPAISEKDGDKLPEQLSYWNPFLFSTVKKRCQLPATSYFSRFVLRSTISYSYSDGRKYPSHLTPWLELINVMKEPSVLFDSYIAYASNLLSFIFFEKKHNPLWFTSLRTYSYSCEKAHCIPSSLS